MKFDKFAQRMSRVILEGEKTATFIGMLFESILSEDDYYLLEKSKTSFKAYYNGRASINALARRINSHTDRSLFEDFINESGEVAVQKLCKVFSDVVPDIDAKNAGIKLAELFDQIITEAAAMPKSSKVKIIDTENFETKLSEQKQNFSDIEAKRDGTPIIPIVIDSEGENRTAMVAINREANEDNQNNEINKKGMHIEHIDHVDQIILGDNNSGPVHNIGTVNGGLTINM